MCPYFLLRRWIVMRAWSWRTRHERHRLDAIEFRTRYSPSIIMQSHLSTLRGLRAHRCPCKECSPPCPVPPT